MSEQLRFIFTQPPSTHTPETAYPPEPLTDADKRSFIQLKTAIKSFERLVTDKRSALSSERLQRQLAMRKGGSYFDIAEFSRSKQEPVAQYALRINSFCVAVDAILQSDPPPSSNHKTSLYLEGIELLEELKVWASSQ